MYLQKTRNKEVWKNIQLLFLGAIFIFIITVVIGILNGLDLVDFEESVLLVHVHSGTLGWITLSIFALAIWLFTGQRDVTDSYVKTVTYGTRIAFVLFLLYVLAFFISFEFDVLLLLPIFGIPALGVMIGAAVFCGTQLRNQEPLTLPHLHVFVGLITASYASFIGLLLGFHEAFENNKFLNDIIGHEGVGAHAAAMEVGYLFIIGMGVIEWQLYGDKRPVTTLGLIQLTTLFLSGFILSMGLLFDITPLIMASLPLELLGVIIFLIRIGPKLVKIHPVNGESDRYLLLTTFFVLFGVGMLIFLISNYADDFSKVPFKYLVVLGHTSFIGVATNVIFCLITISTYDQRKTWPWAEDLILVLLNAGLIGFIISLLAEEATHIAAVMGVAILFGLLIMAMKIKIDIDATAQAKSRNSFE